MKRFTSALCILGALSATAVTSAALADETNPDIIHRQGIYKVVSGHMTALRSSLLLNNEKTQAQAAYHAEGIIEAFKRMGDAYPAGSDKGVTKASPDIWTKPEEFREKGRNAFAAATNLLEVVQMDGSKREIMAAYRDLGASCKACHDDFRQK
jgi:cytochrome c556